MPFSHLPTTALAALLCLAPALASVRSAAAAQGDRAGWQFRIEGNGDTEREFLTFVGRDDGARILTFACERDIDTFGFYAEDLGDLVGPLAKATMSLASGSATFTIPGIIEPDPDTNALGFVAEVPQSNGGQQQLDAALTPLLLSGKPIHMAFGAKARDLPPVVGLLDPAKRFLRSCFGGR
jgi:hypothetical protein